MVTVILPTPLMETTHGNREVAVEASSLSELLGKLEGMFPGLKDRICDEQGAFRRYVNVFLNDKHLPHEAVRYQTLKATDTVHILPSIAGG